MLQAFFVFWYYGLVVLRDRSRDFTRPPPRLHQTAPVARRDRPREVTGAV